MSNENHLYFPALVMEEVLLKQEMETDEYHATDLTTISDISVDETLIYQWFEMEMLK